MLALESLDGHLTHFPAFIIISTKSYHKIQLFTPSKGEVRSLTKAISYGDHYFLISLLCVKAFLENFYIYLAQFLSMLLLLWCSKIWYVFLMQRAGLLPTFDLLFMYSRLHLKHGLHQILVGYCSNSLYFYAFWSIPIDPSIRVGPVII